MTVIRTDIIPNLYANPISSVSKASTAVVTVPVVATVVSTTGTIGTVSGSGTSSDPWTAAITNMSAVTGLISGDVITATAGSGTFAAGGVVTVASVLGNKSIQIYKIGGTIPTAGTVTNISEPAKSTLPTGFADGDVVLFTNPDNKLTTSTAVFAATGCSTSGTTLTIGTLSSGTVTIGQVISAPGTALDGMHIVSGSSSTWTVSGTPGTLSGLSITGAPATFQAGEIIAQPLSSGIALTSVTGSGNTATLNYATQGSAPYTAGQQIIVAGVTPSAYNGTFTVLTSSTTQTTYTVQNAGSFGSASAGGTVALAATGLVTNFITGTLNYIATSGVFDTTHVVTGATTGATAIPSAVTGMNQLLTAGISGSNAFYAKKITSTTFELYTDSGLTTGVDSSAFTTATANAGQYTTFDAVAITEPTP